MGVHLISVEQASYLDVALQTRKATEPLPACPTCQQTAETVTQRRAQFGGNELAFGPCGHVHMVDLGTWTDFHAQAGTNPWVEIFENHCRELQRQQRAAGEG